MSLKGRPVIVRDGGPIPTQQRAVDAPGSGSAKSRSRPPAGVAALVLATSGYVAASRSRRAAGVLLAAQSRSATTRAGSARAAGKAGPVLFRRVRIKPATTAMQT